MTARASHEVSETQMSNARPGHAAPGTHAADAWAGELEIVSVLGELLDDIERTRIANGNRIAALEREYGSSHPELDAIQAHLGTLEHSAELELKRAWRKHPLAPWAKAIPGAGEKLVARLICAVGDPADRQNVAKLWAYCGHGDPSRSRMIPKNATQSELMKRGNPTAKKRTYLLAAQFRRTPSSPYRMVYDDARERYAGRKHESVCVRCGPAGHPAKPGSEWSLAHQDAAALRYVGKMFLRDLWVEAWRLKSEHD